MQVDLEPVLGSESNKIRPAVIVSNDGANQAAERFGRGVITVAPLTSNVTKVFPFQVLVSRHLDGTGLTADSKVQAEQIRAVDRSRVVRHLGRLPRTLHEPLREALTLHLALRAGRP